VTGIDIGMRRLGVIGGTVRDGVRGGPLENAAIVVADATGATVGTAYTDAAGSWEVGELVPGTYLAAADAQSFAWVDQMWDHIDCQVGTSGDCPITTGTPIPVAIDTELDTIDFDLEPTGSISGRIVDEHTGQPLGLIAVSVYNQAGERIAVQNTDAAGWYAIAGLPGGQLFVATTDRSAYLDELYDNLPCLDGPPDGCDPTKGQPVTVLPGGTTRNVDFSLQLWRSALAGRVLLAGTLEPLPGIRIDAWRPDGSHARSTTTTDLGTFQLEVLTGTYTLSTDNATDLLDELYNDIPCPLGSAHAGRCDPTAGEPILVEPHHVTSGLEIVLEPVLPIFTDGFESGTSSAWSATIP
jgi:hypothetical protein